MYPGEVKNIVYDILLHIGTMEIGDPIDIKWKRATVTRAPRSTFVWMTQSEIGREGINDTATMNPHPRDSQPSYVLHEFQEKNRIERAVAHCWRSTAKCGLRYRRFYTARTCSSSPISTLFRRPYRTAMYFVMKSLQCLHVELYKRRDDDPIEVHG